MGLLDNVIQAMPAISGGTVPSASGQAEAINQEATAQDTQQSSMPLTPQPINQPTHLIQPTPPGGPDSGQTEQAPNEDQRSRFNSGEMGQESIRANRWDKVGAAWEEASHADYAGLPGADSMGGFGRQFVSGQIQAYSDKNGGPIMSADDANKQYPGRPEPYTAPVSQMVAELEYNDRQRMAKIDAWKNSSTGGGWIDTGVGLVAGFASPLNAALMAVTGPLVGALGLGEATGLAKLGTRFGENLGINAVTGAASYAVEKQEGANPTVGGAVREAVTGAIGGTLFGYATDGLRALLKGSLARFRSESPDTQAAITKKVVADMEANKTPVIDDQLKVLEERRQGVTQDGQNIQRTTPPAEMPTQVFAAKDSQGNPAVFHDGLGAGTQLTSSGDVANNKVANPEGAKPGHIAEATLAKDEKLLNVDQPANADYIKTGEEPSFLKALEEKTGLPIGDLMHGDASIGDVIKNLGDWAGHESVPEDILQQAQDVAKEQGYTGYSLLRKDADGTPIDHIAHMFDENYPVTGQVSEANPGIMQKLPTDEQTPGPQATQNPQDSVYSSPEVDKEVHDLKHGEALNSTPDYMDPFVKDMFDQAHDQLKQMAENSPVAKQALQELEALQRQTAKDKQAADMAKRLADCVTGGMS